MFLMLPVTAAVASTPQTHTTNDGSIQIEVKYKKVSTNKITFNCNGGKIGSKKTVAINIKKGSKIKKFPAIPKRTGFSFKGWYSKKTGGKKISVNDKITKNVTLFAQWKKKASSRVLTAAEKKLIGRWQHNYYDISFRRNEVRTYSFGSDGKFEYYKIAGGIGTKKTGNYKVSNGKISFTNVVHYYIEDGKKIGDYINTVVEYKIVKQSDGKGENLVIPRLEFNDTSYLYVGWAFQKLKG